MSAPKPIGLPKPTEERLLELLRQKAVLETAIDATVQTAKEALKVPDDWTISDARVGFVPPMSPA